MVQVRPAVDAPKVFPEILFAGFFLLQNLQLEWVVTLVYGEAQSRPDKAIPGKRH
jgi:hypothetical protein